MKLDAQTSLEMLRQINFGEIDGYGDPNLEEYFLDNDYWKKIVEGRCFIVVGRKGTGKSTIYRMIEEQGKDRGAVVYNRAFGDFPFNRLLQFSDNDFMKPNQYQSIWKNMILVDFCEQIVSNPVAGDETNDHFRRLKEFADVCIGSGIEDAYLETLSRTRKTELGLTHSWFSAGAGRETTRSFDLSNCRSIPELNQHLSNAVVNYFITCSDDRRIYIQFDRLDDNYNALQDTQDYLCAVASLLKFSYSFNQELRRRNAAGQAKIIIYLRKDILREISKIDAESARWNDFTFNIDWVIDNTRQYKRSALYAMINRRIRASLHREDIDFDDIFSTDRIDLEDKNGDKIPVFRYIIERTMHRPRDLVQFCIKLQQEADETDALFFRTVKNAEKEFCEWLVYEELYNELNPVIDDLDGLYELLRELGQHSYSLTDFYARVRLFCEKSKKGLTPESLARILYEAGVLQNINTVDGHTSRRSAIRNPGPLDKTMKVIPHPGVWHGISE